MATRESALPLRFVQGLGGADYILEIPVPGLSPEPLRAPRRERSIGVIYRPEAEGPTQYVSARLTRQFEAVLYFDETRAVEPLERVTEAEGGVPPTFPFAV